MSVTITKINTNIKILKVKNKQLKRNIDTYSEFCKKNMTVPGLKSLEEIKKVKDDFCNEVKPYFDDIIETDITLVADNVTIKYFPYIEGLIKSINSKKKIVNKITIKTLDKAAITNISMTDYEKKIIDSVDTVNSAYDDLNIKLNSINTTTLELDPFIGELKTAYKGISFSSCLVKINTFILEIIEKIEEINKDIIPHVVSQDTKSYDSNEALYKNKRLSKKLTDFEKKNYITIGIITLILSVILFFFSGYDFDFKPLYFWIPIYICIGISLFMFLLPTLPITKLDILSNRYITSKKSIRKVLRKIDKDYSLILQKDLYGTEIKKGHKTYEGEDQILIIKAIGWGYLNPKAFNTSYSLSNQQDSSIENLSLFNLFTEEKLMYKPGINPITREGFEFMPQKSAVSQFLSSRLVAIITILVSIISFYIVLRNDIIGLSEITIANFPKTYRIESLPTLNVFDNIPEMNQVKLDSSIDSEFSSDIPINYMSAVKEIYLDQSLLQKINDQLKLISLNSVTIKSIINSKDNYISVMEDESIELIKQLSLDDGNVLLNEQEYNGELDDYLVNKVLLARLKEVKESLENL